MARPPKITPPPPLSTPKEAKKPQEQPTIQEEPEIQKEEPTFEAMPESTIESVPATRPPKDKQIFSLAKGIVILSSEYLKNTEYKAIEKIILKDVSQTGFNKQEARDALQFEAYRRFGAKAKGIINIQYGEKTGFIPGSARFSEVSGEVITWEGKTPPPKVEKKLIEEEKKPEPAKEPKPSSPASDIQKTPPPAPDAKTKPESSALAPVPNPKAEPAPSPSAPAIAEQPLEK